MMHRYHVEAGRELIKAAQFYEAQRDNLGDEFLDEVDAGIASILEVPERWAKLDDEYRRYQLHRFPYGLVYHRISEDTIEIVAVMHLRRRPGYWRWRVR
jgi:plasmid stabilization system protein ParE